MSTPPILVRGESRNELDKDYNFVVMYDGEWYGGNEHHPTVAQIKEALHIPPDNRLLTRHEEESQWFELNDDAALGLKPDLCDSDILRSLPPIGLSS
jgi:hypothetical protein